MELRHLRYFIALAEELSFTHAARRLHVSQPPLSQQISQLEKEIGARLFNRTSRRVELTLAGHSFLSDAQTVLQQLLEAGSRARAIGQGLAGRLEIGLSGSHFLGALPGIMARYSREHPEVAFALHELNPAMQLQALRERRIDVSISRTPVDDTVLSSTLLWKDPVAVALPSGHVLAQRRQRRPLKLLDLREQPFVMLRTDSSAYAQYVLNCCVQAGFAPAVSQWVVELPAAVSLVAAGMGVSLIPESLHELFSDRVVLKSLGKSAPHADVHAVQRTADTSVVLQGFVRFLASSA